MADSFVRSQLALAGLLNLGVVVSVMVLTFDFLDLFNNSMVMTPSLVMMGLSIAALAFTASLPNHAFHRRFLGVLAKAVAFGATMFVVLGETVVLLSSDGSIGPGLLPLIGCALHLLGAVLLLVRALVFPQRRPGVRRLNGGNGHRASRFRP